MAEDIEKALKYPLNFKPLFVFGILFGIMFIALILPVFLMEIRTGQRIMSPGILMPLLFTLLGAVFGEPGIEGVSFDWLVGDIASSPYYLVGWTSQAL